MLDRLYDFFGSGFTANIITMAVIVIPPLIFILKRHFNKENRNNIGAAFRETVKGLSSSDIELKMSSAILMRRFFDKSSEYGVGGTPYARDAVTVIAALLRVQKTGDFQKILADSLRYAPKQFLEHCDLQRVNLSKAYLGGGVSLIGADFYQSNLTGCSFKDAILNNAQFYEANLNGTIFKGAALIAANFSQATLQNLEFKNADLTKAKFDNAVLRNIDFTGANIAGASFNGVVGYNVKGCSQLVLPNTGDTYHPSGKVFISRAGALDLQQTNIVKSVSDVLSRSGYDVVELSRDEYDQSEVITRLEEKMNGCKAVIVFGFKSIHAHKATFRVNTDEQYFKDDVFMSTPWNQIEAGMAVIARIPTLLLSDSEVNDGIFDETVMDSLIERRNIDQCLNTNDGNVLDWVRGVSFEGIGA